MSTPWLTTTSVVTDGVPLLVPILVGRSPMRAPPSSPSLSLALDLAHFHLNSCADAGALVSEKKGGRCT